jgi:chorismate mutase / prephenate dehydrogenase
MTETIPVKLAGNDAARQPGVWCAAMADDPHARLEPLRSELGQIDREIMALVARRQAVSQRIGQVKRDAGIPTRDYRQEKDVIERARAAALEHGLPPALGEDLLLTLIRGSLTIQEKDTVAATGEGVGRRVLVIGGAGHMGRWFVRYLAAQGFVVEIADPSDGPDGVVNHRDWRRAALDHELIILATPMPATAAILEAMAAAPPRGVVFDVGSLKSPLRRGLHALRAAGARVTSIHPMFGPDTELLSGRHLIFVDVGSPEATAAARALFEPTMATLVEMDLESHDRLIAYVLGLSHALNIAFFTALAESGEAAPRLATLSSTTFDAQLGVAARVAQEHPDLYFEIQTLNDYGTESLAALLYAVERLRSVVRANDLDGFRALMLRGRDYLKERGKR